MSWSPRWSLPLLVEGQAQKHVTVNESLLLMDTLVHAAAESSTLSQEPSWPPDGACYLLTPDRAGAAWSGFQEGSLACWRDGAWREIRPQAGLQVWIKDEQQFRVYDGTQWIVV